MTLYKLSASVDILNLFFYKCMRDSSFIFLMLLLSLLTALQNV